MMINGVNGVNPLNNVQNLRKTENAANVKSSSDTVSVSPEAEKMAEAYYMDKIAQETPDVRADRIAEIKEKIKEKDDNLFGKMASEGTTPRRLTDLIGSLCDLTSGSGDKGTPIVHIQGYFDNYTTE